MHVYKKKNSNTKEKKRKKNKSILKANNVTKMTHTKKNYREVTKKTEKRTEVTQCFLHP